MEFEFTNTQGHEFKPGMLYLGVDDEGREIGVQTERHAITIGGAGAGKGACCLIMNSRRWPHNLLGVDPKGEIIENSWIDRQAMGQTVAALDPFMIADIPVHLRVSCNLLAHIDPKSLTAREDIRVIADGTVIRFKAEDGTWDNGAVSVIAGVIDYVLATHPPEERDLTAVRRILVLPPDALKEAFKEMAETPTRTGLARAAAAIGLSESKKHREFVSGAVEHTEWIDSPAMYDILRGGKGFDLSQLKTGKASLFLILPPKYIAEHSRFLRLFTRAALNAMEQNIKGGQKCLFLLDEFFSLGHIDQIAKAAGLMRGYGVQLWPFLQDLGQLTKLYGAEGAHTFFGNADVHMFFGNTDPMTLAHISERIGRISPSEVPVSRDEFNITAPENQWWESREVRAMKWDMTIAELHEARHHDSLRNQNLGRYLGQPRIAPEEVKEIIGKKDQDVVARHMIVFGKGKDVFKIRLQPYFLMPLKPIHTYSEFKFSFSPLRDYEHKTDFTKPMSVNVYNGVTWAWFGYQILFIWLVAVGCVLGCWFLLPTYASVLAISGIVWVVIRLTQDLLKDAKQETN